MIICANEMGTETEYAPCGTEPLCEPSGREGVATNTDDAQPNATKSEDTSLNEAA